MICKLYIDRLCAYFGHCRVEITLCKKTPSVFVPFVLVQARYFKQHFNTIKELLQVYKYTIQYNIVLSFMKMASIDDQLIEGRL